MAKDLFGQEPEGVLDAEFGEPSEAAPLADRMRPAGPAEFVGQAHLLGEGHVLERALAGDLTQSLILWGPPGTGKTTLARLISRATSARFVAFSAVLSGVKEVRAITGWGLARSKEVAETPGALLVSGLGEATAAGIADRLRRAGATVEIEKVEVTR